MARSERLFAVLQILRTLPPPVTAERLARETGMSERSIYRDIDSLRSGGASIEGERGYGYTLVEDGSLPPQAFNRIEIEALILGMAEVRQMGDPALALAADAVMAKLAATLPSLGQQHLLHAVSRVRRGKPRYPCTPGIALLREACWHEQALDIEYQDGVGRATRRRILPLAVVYLDNMLVVLAWCCLRNAFRKFRADRIVDVETSAVSFRPRRAALLRSCLEELERHA